MNRRDVIGGLACTAAVLPRLARAQVSKPVIGFLNAASPQEFGSRVAAFRHGLDEAGWVEGQDVAIEFRWAEGRYERLPALAAELARRNVDIIVATGGSAVAAKQATPTVPMVFIVGGDPVHLGLVNSLSRPEGNATGITLVSVALGGKRMELLHQLVPSATRIAFMVNSDSPAGTAVVADAELAARSLNRQLNIVQARNDSDLEKVFADLSRWNADALLVDSDPFFISRRDKLVAMAASQRLPTIYDSREYVIAGGLVSYGTDYDDAYRQAGLYAGRILKGERPGDLPVLQPTKFALVINLRTATTLGLDVPPTLLARADEVIE